MQTDVVAIEGFDELLTLLHGLDGSQSDIYLLLYEKMSVMENALTSIAQSDSDGALRSELMAWQIVAQGATFGAILALMFAVIWSKL